MALRRGALRGSVAALAMLAGAGCTSGASVLVDISVPRPLVEPLGAHMGVYYDAELTSYVHSEEVDGGAYTIDIGASQAPVFTQVFDAMFERVVPMARDTAGDADAAAGDAATDEAAAPPVAFLRVDGGDAPVDGVLAPTIDQVQFSTPEQTRTDFYEVWIRYRVRLFDADGTVRKEWPLIGYGKASNRNSGDPTEQLNAATTWALRDAAAVLAFELRDNIQVAAGGAEQENDAKEEGS